MDGDRFINSMTNKKGTVEKLKNDEYEKNQRKSDPSHYRYSVKYDDGTFESYENQKYMFRYEDF